MPEKIFYVVVTYSLILAGCAVPNTIWSSHPALTKAENPYYQAMVIPKKDSKGVYTMFHIELVNRSSENLQIDWNESAYLYQGISAGPLIFNGADLTGAIRNKRPMEKIASGQKIIKEVGPIKFASIDANGIERNQSAQKQLTFGPLPAGYNGVKLVLRSAEKAIVEHFQVRLAPQ